MHQGKLSQVVVGGGMVGVGWGVGGGGSGCRERLQMQKMQSRSFIWKACEESSWDSVKDVEESIVVIVLAVGKSMVCFWC